MMLDRLLPPYLRDMADYLQHEDPELWDWFNSAKVRTEHAENVRLTLLKSTYRLDQDADPVLYKNAHELAEALEISSPITLYQAQQNQCLNASLAYIPGEAHVIFYGPLLKILQPEEIKAVLGHELSHFNLWERNEQRFFTTSQILNALVNDDHAKPCHYESARLYSLFTEIYCDRGALHVTKDLNAVIRTLVKVSTGLDNVNAESYLSQANEILEMEQQGSEEDSHPESFLRSKAIQLWSEQANEADIMKMIRGPMSLNHLDLLEKRNLAALTRSLIVAVLQYPWMQSDDYLVHARQFFHDISDKDVLSDPELHSQADAELAKTLKYMSEDVQKYFCYVLLDFSVIDPELDEAALAVGCLLSELYGIQAGFKHIVQKELQYKQSKIDNLVQKAPDIVARLQRGEIRL